MKKRVKFTLKALRINHGWSQEQMAQKIGVSIDTIQNYESYKTFPDVPIIEKILNATGLKYDDIIFLPCHYGKTVKNEIQNDNQKGDE